MSICTLLASLSVLVAAAHPKNGTCLAKTCRSGQLALLQTGVYSNSSLKFSGLPGIPQELQEEAIALLRTHHRELGFAADEDFAVALVQSDENQNDLGSDSMVGNLRQEKSQVHARFFNPRRRRTRRRRRRSAQYSVQKDCAFFLTGDKAFGAGGGWKLIGHNSGTCDDLAGDYVDAKEASSGIFFAARNCNIKVYDSANCAGTSQTITSGSSSRPGIYGTNDLALKGWQDRIASIKCQCS